MTFWGNVLLAVAGPLARLPRPVQRVLYGTAIAVVMATMFSLWVLYLSLRRGSTYFAEYDITTWSIVRSYYFAGLVAGPVCGLLSGLTKWGLGAFFVGTVGGTIAYAVIWATVPALDDMPRWLVLVPGILVGGGIGWSQYREAARWCPSYRTVRVWLITSAIGMAVAWIVGVVWRPSEPIALLAMGAFFGLAIVATVVTLVRSSAGGDLRRSADNR